MARKKGPPTKLSTELENRIEQWIKHMARIGYGQTITDILDKVEELLNKLNRYLVTATDLASNCTPSSWQGILTCE